MNFEDKAKMLAEISSLWRYKDKNIYIVHFHEVYYSIEGTPYVVGYSRDDGKNYLIELSSLEDGTFIPVEAVRTVEYKEIKING